MTALEIGRLLRSGVTGFVVGCRVNQLDSPSFGALARVPLEDGSEIYGLIHDIRIEDDGLVRQLITIDGADQPGFAAVIADNRVNRNVPVEMSVLAVGHRQAGGRILHMLPPRPALSLDCMYLCEPSELRDFTAVGRFGYFRHILRNQDIPTGELLAAHLLQAQRVHQFAGSPAWLTAATQELITLLRDDYATLMTVLSAIREISPQM